MPDSHGNHHYKLQTFIFDNIPTFGKPAIQKNLALLIGITLTGSFQKKG